MVATLKMLYGPPGTGKTWLAAREAVRAIEPEEYQSAAASANPEGTLQVIHQRLVNEGRILWVTFHPSYSYEDFVEGYRPVLVNGAVAYKVVDGPFKKLCERVRWKVDLEVGDKLADASGKEAAEVIEVDRDGWVLRVRPGRSDQVAESYDKFVPRRLIDQLLDNGFKPNIFSVSGGGESSYDLATYGVDPNSPDVQLVKDNPTDVTLSGPKLKKVLAARTGMLNSFDLGNNAVYGAVMRRLIDIRGLASPGKPVALVIDEFNRADPSRVFGELLTLLELDKREGMPEERKVWLPHSQKTFSIPATVSVVGTMNTVDKSLAPVDFAMRRRFRFEYVGASPELLDADFEGVNLQQLLRRINARLGALLGSGYEIGHAFFLSRKLAEVSERMDWSGRADSKLRSLAYVLRSSVVPTIVEYFHEDWRKTRAVVGETVFAGQSVSLFDVPEVEDAFTERLPEDYELVDGRVSYSADWWNPAHRSWNPDQFRGFLIALASGA
jgi:5-methylcytosine-specific restriction protein B